MPNATETTEKFPANTPKGEIEKERNLKIQGGAIKSIITGGVTKEWVLTTTWDVLS